MLEVVCATLALLPERAAVLVKSLTVPGPHSGIAFFAFHTLEA